jgi:hypothetical protein
MDSPCVRALKSVTAALYPVDAPDQNGCDTQHEEDRERHLQPVNLPAGGARRGEATAELS